MKADDLLNAEFFTRTIKTSFEAECCTNLNVVYTIEIDLESLEERELELEKSQKF